MSFEDRIEILNQYLFEDAHTVAGWCNTALWQTIWPLYKLIGDGPIGEIGVFEGKFLIGLAKTFGPKLEHSAIDVFELQRFNIDNAGMGKKDKLLENAERLGISRENINCWTRDSVTLRANDAKVLNEHFGGFNFFSVDGCHEVLHTYRDVQFAMEVTKPNGIITVDDYINPNWPGVMEAMAKLYFFSEPAFVPLVYTSNKLFLCSVSYHEEYLAAVASFVKTNYPETRIKEVKRFGYDTLTILRNEQDWGPLVV